MDGNSNDTRHEEQIVDGPQEQHSDSGETEIDQKEELSWDWTMIYLRKLAGLTWAGTANDNGHKWNTFM